MSYNKLLTHPLWIKKRNRIFKRDKYTCTCCGSKEKLSVHHTFYYKHLVPPWEYSNSSLLTVCYTCHQNYHETHEHVIKENPPSYYKKQRNRRKRNKGKPRGIPYPCNLSLAGKVAFKEKWLKRKKNLRNGLR